MENFENYEDLANAIIIQAVIDFRYHYKKYMQLTEADHSYYYHLNETMKFIEFVLSDWFVELTQGKVVPEIFLENVYDEVKNEC